MILFVFIFLSFFNSNSSSQLNIDVITLPRLQSDLESIEKLMINKTASGSVSMQYHFLESKLNFLLEINVCNKNNTSFAIILHHEPLLSSIANSLSKLGIITFGIPINWIYRSQQLNKYFPTGITSSSWSVLLSFLFQNDIWMESVIFTDFSFENELISVMLNSLSNMKVRGNPVYITSMNESEIKAFMVKEVKRKIRFLIIYSNNLNNTISVLEKGIQCEILQSNYFWVINNVLIKQSDIINILNSNLNPNIAIIQPTPVRYLTNICPISECKNNSLLYQYYDSLDSILNLSKSISSKMPLYFNICSNLPDRMNLNNYFQISTYQNQDWNSFLSRSQSFDLFTTISEDFTHFTPNIFTYSTEFILSAIYNAKTNQFQLMKNEFYSNSFKDWKNKTIYICSPSITPGLNYISNQSLSYLNQTRGLVTEMLNIISRKMNFVPMFYQAADKQWGAQMKDSLNFTGCIGDVFNKKALIAASFFTINDMRLGGVDFTAPFFEDSNGAALQFPQPKSKMWNIFRPFHLNTWSLIIIATLFTSIFSFILSRYSPLSAWNLKLEFSVSDEIRIREHTWNIVGSFFMQGQDFYPYAMSARTVLAVWWIFAVIIFGAYSADLTSFLTVKDQEQLIKTLEELSLRKDLKIIVVEGTSTAIILQGSNYSVYQELNSRVQYIRYIDECPNMILQDNANNLVCISDSSANQYVVNRNCSKIYMIPDTFNPANIAFGVQIDAPYKPILDSYIRILTDSGDIEKWITKYWSINIGSVDTCDNSNTQGTALPIDLEELGGVFICTAILIGLSLLILCTEVFWTHSLDKPLDSFACQY